jgi:hypothetical protein
LAKRLTYCYFVQLIAHYPLPITHYPLLSKLDSVAPGKRRLRGWPDCVRRTLMSLLAYQSLAYGARQSPEMLKRWSSGTERAGRITLRHGSADIRKHVFVIFVCFVAHLSNRVRLLCASNLGGCRICTIPEVSVLGHVLYSKFLEHKERPGSTVHCIPGRRKSSEITQQVCFVRCSDRTQPSPSVLTPSYRAFHRRNVPFLDAKDRPKKAHWRRSTFNSITTVYRVFHSPRR